MGWWGRRGSSQFCVQKALKGLPYEIDLALMTSMVSSRSKKGTGPFFKFLVAPMILSRKKCILRLMRVYIGLIMLAACTYSRFPCFLLVSRVWEISSGIGPCFPLVGGLCKLYANAGEK
jgi:hypothetical protein